MELDLYPKQHSGTHVNKETYNFMLKGKGIKCSPKNQFNNILP